MNFDHAVVNVLGEMDAAAETYRQFGFFLTPRGYHTLGSINHLAVFGETYLELLGYAEGEREKRAELWVHPLGLTGLAFRASESAALHDQMEADGAPVEPYKDFSRPVEIDGQSFDAAFRTFQIDRGQVANGRIFFCQHKTPELLWRDAYMSHPNGVTELTEAVVACDDPEALLSILDTAEGLTRGDEGRINAGTTDVRFVSRDEALRDFGPVPDSETGHMRMVGLGFRCRSLDTLTALLRANKVAFADAEGTVTIAPDVARGLYLRFTEA